MATHDDRGKTLAVWLKESKSKDIARQTKAKSVLRQIPAASLPEIIEAMADHDNEINEAAVETLVELGSIAVPHLLKARASTDAQVREGAQLALARIEALASVGVAEALSGLAPARVSHSDRRGEADRFLSPEIERPDIEMQPHVSKTVLPPAAQRDHSVSQRADGNRATLSFGIQNFVRLLFDFRGRAPRRVFWAVILGTEGVFLLSFYFLAWFLNPGSEVYANSIILIFLLGVWLRLVATVKRFHDRNRSAWWMFVACIPIVGVVWLFVECGCLRGTIGENDYGPDPT